MPSQLSFYYIKGIYPVDSFQVLVICLDESISKERDERRCEKVRFTVFID